MSPIALRHPIKDYTVSGHNDVSEIKKLLDALDEAQATRRNLEWAECVNLPSITDPECPQSERERAIINELTDPSKHDLLVEYIRQLEHTGPINQSAASFYKSLLSVSLRRARGFE